MLGLGHTYLLSNFYVIEKAARALRDGYERA